MISVIPGFLRSPRGRLYVIEYLPVNPDQAGRPVVFVPPFGEEMNRCRRMVAKQAMALANAGRRSVLFDLYGTGDSEGELGESDWETWCANLTHVVNWISKRTESDPDIVAIRLGALLVTAQGVDVLRRSANVVFWHPCTSGRAFLRQFYRIRLASEMIGPADWGHYIQSIRDELATRGKTEIGGYELSSQLIASIESANLEIEAELFAGKLYWYDVSATATDALSPASSRCIQAITRCGVTPRAATIHDQQFWATVETTTAPGLLKATTNALTRR